jgi:hypothetical protein
MKEIIKIYKPAKPTKRELKRDLMATFLNHIKRNKL